MPELLNRLKTAISDRYAIERELGAGGMATVYLAEDIKHHRPVAVKVLRPELAAVIGAERFLREIEITARLTHPHILTLLESGEADGFLYYVMPFVEEESLRDRLNSEKQLPLDDALQFAREVADALSYAHSHDVIHRDIKPENILLEAGHAVIADFGIARAVTAAGGEVLTETGIAIGTPQYMSPEQAAGSKELDGRSDVYSLGCVVYEMLAGQPPFTGPTVESIVHQHIGVEAPPITNLRPAVPAEIAGTIARALAKAPADRYGTASQLVDALTPSAVTPAPQAAVRTPARRLGVYAGGVVVALLGGLWLLSGTLGPGASEAGAEIPRLVVLPFDNLGAPEDEYFADGITEAITTRLAGIGGLGIISRQSAIQYKNSGKNAQQIAEELGVQYIMEGTIQRERPGDPTSRVRVNPQLIRTSDDTHLWASPYDVAMIEVFQVYAQIAEEVAREVNVRISTVERGRLGARSTESGPAYELYLRATQLRSGADRRANAVAEELLKQALALDPGFAVATAQLSQVYTWRAVNLGESRRWADSGLALARRAIDDDPSVALGYWALGVGYTEMGRLTEAAAAFRKLLEVQPSDAGAMVGLGWIELLRGKLAEAVDFWGKAHRLDPTNAQILADMVAAERVFGEYAKAERWLQAWQALRPEHVYLPLSRIYLTLAEGKTSEALAQAERFLTDRPGSFLALQAAADSWLQAGNYEQARQHLEAMQRIAPEDWNFWGRTHRTLYGWVLLKLGDAERGLELLDKVLRDAQRLRDQGDERPGLLREIAAVYAARGDRERAYQWLERAIDSGWRLERLRPTPLFESLRGEERFQELMERIDADVRRMKTRVEREGLGPPLPSPLG